MSRGAGPPPDTIEVMRSAGVRLVAGVDFLPGPTFSGEDALDNWLRLAFVLPSDVVADGLARLAEIWRGATAT